MENELEAGLEADAMLEPLPDAPRFAVGQWVQHRLWGKGIVSGLLRDGPTWLYDLSPSLSGGEVQIAGRWYSQQFMLNDVPVSECQQGAIGKRKVTGPDVA